MLGSVSVLVYLSLNILANLNKFPANTNVILSVGLFNTFHQS